MRQYVDAARERGLRLATRVKEGATDLREGERPILRTTLLVLALVVLLYYPVGMLWYHTVDDDVAFEPSPTYQVAGGSKAVATTAALVSREVGRWAPNKPFFHPAWMLDNMPNYQMGILYAASRFVAEMGDQLGRTRNSSAIDPDLDHASGQLRFDGRIWYWGSGNLLPTQPAQAQYEKAVVALQSYNDRLSRRQATYDRRADNLIALLQRVAADLGSLSAALDDRALNSNLGYFDFRADDLFYNVKGRLYGYYLILRDVGADFTPVLQEKQAVTIWQQMLSSLRTAVELDPLMVANGPEDALFVPSHLAAQGFYLLRARTQIDEVADSLLK